MTKREKQESLRRIEAHKSIERASSSLERVLRAHRFTRCGFCYWALYDGEWCQNKSCEWHGKEPPEKVKLSNAEAATLIEAMRPNV